MIRNLSNTINSLSCLWPSSQWQYNITSEAPRNQWAPSMACHLSSLPKRAHNRIFQNYLDSTRYTSYHQGWNLRYSRNTYFPLKQKLRLKIKIKKNSLMRNTFHNYFLIVNRKQFQYRSLLQKASRYQEDLHSDML